MMMDEETPLDPSDFRRIVEIVEDGISVVRRGKTLYRNSVLRSRLGEAGGDGGRDGLGLGLAIVHAILRLHQVEPHIDSAPGRGTTVGFCLPVNHAAEPRDRDPSCAAGSVREFWRSAVECCSIRHPEPERNRCVLSSFSLYA